MAAQPVTLLYICNEQDCYVPMGLAAAMTVHRACSEVTMPALEMEMLCCSMASWMLVLSASFIWRTGSGSHTFGVFFGEDGNFADNCGNRDSAHLIKLVDQTDSAVCQHQRSSLQRPLAAHRVSLNVGGQTDGGGPLTCGEHRAARHLLHVPADGNTSADVLIDFFNILPLVDKQQKVCMHSVHSIYFERPQNCIYFCIH